VRILLRPTVFLGEVTAALDAMDTPSGDGINSYVVSRAIRSHGMTVALSGVGGDELFAGYPFFDQYLKLRKMDWLSRLPSGLRNGLATLLSPRGGDGKRGRMTQLLRLNGYAIEHTYPIFRQILSPAAISRLTALSIDGSSLTSVQQELIAGRTAVQQQPLLSQVSIAEYLGYTQHTLLKDTDQMGMAASLEVREPFFDQDLVEFVLAVPDKWKTPAYPKSLLVESLKPLLPDEIVFRKKQGFLFPWKVWLKNDLKTFCEEHLGAMAERPFINADGLLDRWKRFLAGDESVRWPEIWLFVVLDHWMQKNQMV
jgi:asparagine synthase (glutamine-hydrolysing)